jgi:thiamine biosynthesis lipoprotein ApbE
MQLRNFLLLLLIGLSPATALPDWLRDEAAIMGTAITVELWHEEPAQGRALIEAVFTEMRRIDELMSSYKPDSELSQVNAGAASGPVVVSRELFRLIEHRCPIPGSPMAPLTLPMPVPASTTTTGRAKSRTGNSWRRPCRQSTIAT